MHSSTFFTDYYQLTMAYAYWKQQLMDREAVFTLYFRSNPFAGGFSVAAGLETACDWLSTLAFSADDIAYLKTLSNASGATMFDPAFLHFLAESKFSVDIEAIPEGTLVFPYEPIVKVRGPIWQCQWIETLLLNTINFQSLIATKAARIVLAARGREVVEFGLRRAQGVDGGLSATRAAYIGGISGTSNMMAAKKFGIPLRGTHSHSWVMSYESEREAFEKFVECMGEESVLLVDTYDTISGLENAIAVGKELQKKGKTLRGVRLDSGDFAYLSQQTRKRLDEAGLTSTKIIASNELDEYLIQSLFLQEAEIDVWGIGTRLITAQNQPAMSGVYKLASVRTESGWSYKIKVSDQPLKTSNPGIHCAYRYFDESGAMRGDLICDESEDANGVRWLQDPIVPHRKRSVPNTWRSEPLLVPVFKNGKRVLGPTPLTEVRARLTAQLERLHPGHKRLENPHTYPVGLSPHLAELKEKLISEHHPR